ncbi:MAG: bifunctional 2-polyprenyl-6-hydroxyphenol methylase/3-demethylubiquinol 3-O-methyltransferase UbiG [Pseudomonadales bacterium]|nr:bifunctional 2-polyprenyl-6-hydroxyphenol methylase/3-demethylubiquinol 3-O-methyltransferase UbiG [Pseudomonadales bacterium]MBO6595877.1 bifunctional 2-polyprenyl-6-hydroxyphenol methylase/3-demethylubiquinol 3-O-methyltransferase UbiG [Pseudomonadales bacterium]MBO6822361.1 bifunctional 2-polyprenyl-6-hydroxyphenol methylase/3-demethylubiquinol 3-O-methyltransferase UbiG [Pseudomonadales bacterium]MBO7005876.1 bifunctional 2-polyprenyl-6-hydroxyphenol methylase/3-demethylubiquinol 3-O-meth
MRRAEGVVERISDMNSAIKKEISQFNRLASTWWDNEGPMWPLHRLNALRVPFILRHARRHFDCSSSADFSALRFLDIGCGAGILSESIARTGASVVGIDAADRNIDIARQHGAAEGLDIAYFNTTIESFESDELFDVVLNMEVVEHVADPQRFLKDCARRVRPGGLMFVATINRTVYSAITAIFGAEYVLGWLPKGTHQWGQFVTPEETRVALQSDDFSVIEQTGVAVNPLTKSMALNAFLGGNYMLVAERRA